MMRHQRIRRAAAGAGAAALVLTLACPAISQGGYKPAARASEASGPLSLLKEKRTIRVTGKEDWDALRGFGTDAPMVQMMILMMVGGSGMEHMSMGSMKMEQMTPGSMKMPGEQAAPSAMPAGGPVITMETGPDTLKVGKNDVMFHIVDAAGKPLARAKVTTSVAMTSMDMGTAHPTAAEASAGHYKTNVNLLMSGPWRITVTVTPEGGKPASRSFDVSVK